MLSDTHYMELLDQGLKAIEALSASDRLKELNTIGHTVFALTPAGENVEFYLDLGLDVALIYERTTEFGSKALLYSYTDCMLVVVSYHDLTDRHSYQGYSREEIELALTSYMYD
ncbi:MAG: hypothetical protein ACXAE3_06525 [Candidatus Kariarchaeaceae archaeon]|jgi:hypothetical protein